MATWIFIFFKAKPVIQKEMYERLKPIFPNISIPLSSTNDHDSSKWESKDISFFLSEKTRKNITKLTNSRNFFIAKYPNPFYEVRYTL